MPESEGKQTFLLEFSNGPTDYLVPLFFSILFLFVIARFEQIYPHLSPWLSKLSLGFKENEEDY